MRTRNGFSNRAGIPVVLAGMVLASCASLVAQEEAVPGNGGSGPAVEAGPSTAKLDAAAVGTMLSELDASGLEAPVKEALKAKYQAALDSLKEAESSRARTSAFRETIQSAPGETSELKRQLDALPAAGQPVEVVPIEEVDELRKEVELRRAALSDLANRLASADQEVDRVKGRPVEIGTRLPQARAELAELAAKLAVPESGGDPSPGRAADQTVLEARRQALEAEIGMLLQEQLSQAVRENLLLARRDLLARQRDIDQAGLSAFEDQLKQARMSNADRLAAEVESLEARVTAADGEPGPMLAELRQLAGELRESAQRLEQAGQLQGELRNKIDALAGDYKRIKEEVKLGGFEGSFAQLMAEQRRRLPNPRPLAYSIKAREKSLSEQRLAGFRIEGKLRGQTELEKQLADSPDPELARRLEIRAEVLGELSKSYRSLVRELARIDANERAYHDLIVEVRSYLSNQLFWQRSSPPVGPGFLGSIPAGLRWALGLEQSHEGLRAVARIPLRQPLLTVVFGLVVVALQVLRSRTSKSLQECGQKIRRISNDRYSHTLRALLDSVMLAAPVPLVTGFIAWALLRDPDGSNWVRGFGHGLALASVFLICVLPLRTICRPGGLGIVHFGWDEQSASLLRSSLLRLLLVLVPALLITGMTSYEESSQHFDSLGRLSFIIAHIWTTMVFIRLFRPADGMLAGMIDAHPGRLVAKTRHFWYALVVLSPVALIVLACLGYTFTGIALSKEFLGTLLLIAAGVLFYGMVMRWFMIKERKLALTEALAERRARRQAEDQDEGPSEEVVAVDEEALQLDLASVGEQTRRMLRSAISVGVVALIWWWWESTLPLDEVLSEQPAGGGLSFLSVVQAILVITIAVTMVRNLPGLLDLAGLRNSSMEPGTRYAVATICQYVAIAIAIALLLQILQIDWSQFGWIAAALSVGLGFGLQEVVANFVCGIILLFERPMRVGDVVTIGPVTGTVTKIRMRATTITNWDRQELIVPNKDFVTGSLINWTLSNRVNRVVIAVGVAYGSDTVRARDILLEVATDHSLILDDPAPVTAFEAFGDSTLDLSLRCYLPDMDNRLKTTTELHSEVDRRFKEAGIEIAFPQRDLHIRNWNEQVLAKSGPVDAAGEGGSP